MKQIAFPFHRNGHAALVLLAASCFLVAGCGSDQKKTETAKPAKQTPTTTKAQPQLPNADVAPSVPTTEQTTNTTTLATTFPRPFSANSPWNTVVDNSPVDSRSDRLMRLAQERIGVIETPGSKSIQIKRRRLNSPLFINTTKWTTPIVDSRGGKPTKVFCRQLALPPKDNFCGDGAYVRTLSIPPDARPLPQYDGWFTVIDRDHNSAYDLWRARRSRDGKTMSYQFMRQWDLRKTGFLPPGYPSARGSGLPLFAGVIVPSEIQTGRIDHALAISVPGPAQRRYAPPASVTDGNGSLASLPIGARIRLRGDVDINEILNRKTDVLGLGKKRFRLPQRTNRRAARAIMVALQRYGAIVVDRARVPTLYAQLNARWNNVLRSSDNQLLDDNGNVLPPRIARLRNQGTPLLRGNEIQSLFLDDFEVVTLPQLLQDPPLNATSVVPLAGGVLPQKVGQATAEKPARTGQPLNAGAQKATPQPTRGAK